MNDDGKPEDPFDTAAIAEEFSPISMSSEQFQDIIDTAASLAGTLNAEVAIGVSVPGKPKLTVTVSPVGFDD